MEAFWNQAKAAIKQRLPSHSYRMWIEPLGLQSWTNGSAVLLAPNFFSRKRVTENYRELLETVLSDLAQRSCRVTVEVGGGATGETGRTQPRQIPLSDAGLRFHNGRRLRQDFTFDQFVVGGSNDFAYTAALSLASRASGTPSTLYLMSRSGLGKSHLAQAVGHHLLCQSQTPQVFYTTAEDFTNELVHAFQTDEVPRFKQKYQNGCDILLLEDVHYLTGKERTQVELSRTLDSLQESGKKIIFSSCCLPDEIPRLNDELRTRMGNGLISQIDPPDYRTRVRILQRKAAARGYHLSEEVVGLLASELHEDVRQLESGLTGVIAKSSLLGLDIDLPLAESVVQTLVRARKTVTIEAIKRLVCRQYRITMPELVSRSRKKCHVRPRQVAIYLARRYTDAPLEAIGRSFKRYHATALHSIRCVERNLAGDNQLQRQLEVICQRLDTGDF